MAFNIEKHDREPTIFLTMGGNALIFFNVLHAKPRPDIAIGIEGDDVNSCPNFDKLNNSFAVRLSRHKLLIAVNLL